MEVNVLGTTYTVLESNPRKDERLTDMDGYCDTSVKKLVVDDMRKIRELHDKEDLQEYKKTVIRHELTHAFLYESGLDNCCPWAKNEDMVDWIALQGLKLYQAWQEAGAV